MNRVSRYLIWHPAKIQLAFTLGGRALWQTYTGLCTAAGWGAVKSEAWRKEITFSSNDDRESTDLAMICGLFTAKMWTGEQYLCGLCWSVMQHPRGGLCHTSLALCSPQTLRSLSSEETVLQNVRLTWACPTMKLYISDCVHALAEGKYPHKDGENVLPGFTRRTIRAWGISSEYYFWVKKRIYEHLPASCTSKKD